MEPIKFLVEPWAHQRDAINRAAERDYFGLFLEMGTGKTATCINILRTKFKDKGRLLRTLILCPPIVVPNWKREFSVHSQIAKEKIILLQGTGEKRAGLISDCLETDETLGISRPVEKILVTNFETLLMPKAFLALKKWAPEVLVVDESHKCKDMRSKRTKAVIELADIAKYRYILSGTPVLNSPLDLFSQFRILDRGKTFGKNFFVFRANYFEDKNAAMPSQRYFPNWQPKTGSYQRIQKLVLENAARATKDECLDLPPLVRKEVHVTMGAQQARLYKDMKEELVAFLNDKACVATLAITKALRLQQIVSGFLTVEEELGERSNITLKENPRAEALKTLLEELTPTHKVLVWAVFKNNYEEIRRVCNSLGIMYVEVHGEVSDKRKHENVETFRTNPKVKVFIGHPGSGGIGINLVEASYSIFYSRGFSLEHDQQAEARNHRGGSEIHSKVTRIDLVCPGTIDELILSRLSKKQEMGEKLLGDLREKL